MFLGQIEEHKQGQKMLSSSSSSSSLKPWDRSFVDEEALVQGVSEAIYAAEVSGTPLKLPSSVTPRSRTGHVKRKKSEITADFKKKIGRKLSDVYGEPTGTDKEDPCSSCSDWVSNLRAAYVKSASQLERYRLLTLFPSNLKKKDIPKAIPEVTKHALDQSRKLKKKWGSGRHLTHTKDMLSTKTMSLLIALTYYTSDAKDCSRQSPNKKDVVRLFIDGQEVFVTKRFMTRSIRETYKEFKAANPESKMGLTKFYSLRPKWVKKHPVHEECVCVCCANFILCLTSLSNAAGKTMTFEDVQKIFLCENPSQNCFLLRCEAGSNRKDISLEMLRMSAEDELELSLWESGGELMKKHLEATAFRNELNKWTKKYLPHYYIRRAQQRAIWLEKANVKPCVVVLHFDFAENWSIVLQRAVQGYDWKTKMVTIFTRVATTTKGTLSFDVLSDDTCHDSAHALFALTMIEDRLEELLPVFLELIYVSDGAPSHFKNRHQLHEF
ncbi:uncharacterized protein ISCGN_031368 [Ixodes scapularis]